MLQKLDTLYISFQTRNREGRKAAISNAKAAEARSKDHYQSQMRLLVSGSKPYLDIEELTEAHNSTKKAAVDLFLQEAHIDEKNVKKLGLVRTYIWHMWTMKFGLLRWGVIFVN